MHEVLRSVFCFSHQTEDTSSDQGEEDALPMVLSGGLTLPIFQKALLNFLDNYAPVVGEWQRSFISPNSVVLLHNNLLVPSK